MGVITIPGFDALKFEHLVLDYNGTIAVDGCLIPGVASRLINLASAMTIHVVTADTFGKARARLSEIPCRFSLISEGKQADQKRDYVRNLGSRSCVCIGNGRNDALMLKEAALGIGVVQTEGACSRTLFSADVVCTDINSALDLLKNPLRLIATLRS